MGQLGGSSGLDRARLIWVGALLGPLSVDGSAGAGWSWVASAGHFLSSSWPLIVQQASSGLLPQWLQSPKNGTRSQRPPEV